jgi:uncharacterized metal-binding protein YceD (DUF177 family)
MTRELVVDVGDLVGHPEAERAFSGSQKVALRLGESVVSGPMNVTGVVRGTVDGVLADYTVTAIQHFARTPDEDGYGIEDKRIDMAGAATDELSLGIPAAPVCRDDCKGLCPVCGNDLNSDPCDGHGDDSESPFAALKDLFDS